MPRYICAQCISQLNLINLFKIQCQQTDLFLKNKITELKQQLLSELSTNESLDEQAVLVGKKSSERYIV